MMMMNKTKMEVLDVFVHVTLGEASWIPNLTKNESERKEKQTNKQQTNKKQQQNSRHHNKI